MIRLVLSLTVVGALPPLDGPLLGAGDLAPVNRAHGPPRRWRTEAGQAVPDGTYYYFLKGTGFDQVEYDLHGELTLMRNQE